MLINRDYRWLWAGHTVAQFGDTVFVTAVLIWVATLLRDNPHAPIAGGAVVALSSAATLLIAPAAGVFVDRSPDKRAVMLRTDLWRCGAIAVVCVLSLLPSQVVPLWLLGVALGMAIVLVAAAGQFFNPARFVTVGDIVPGPLLLRETPRSYLGRVSAVFTPALRLASLLSAAMAGSIAGGLSPDFSTTILGVQFGRIDAVYAGSAVLLALSALYALMALRRR